VELRERLAFPGDALASALRELRRAGGVLESCILSTCNRVEVVFTPDASGDTEEAIEGLLERAGRIGRETLAPFLYHYEGRDAVRHVFRVAASLDSMVVGEPQILGQLKAAYAAAKAEGVLTGELDTVLTHAFSVAKRVRSETDIGENAVSVSFAAVELAREIFGSLSGRKVLIVGAGKMSELAARHLKRAGASGILVANRTRQRAEAMAEMFEGRVVEYDRLRPMLVEIDILIASSGAPHYILTRDDMRQAMSARRNRPVFLIDIAVPRNIEPSVNELDNVFLYDMDDLGRVVETNRLGRLKEAEQAEQIVEEEVDRLMARLRAREVAPTIASLNEQLETIRRAEIERLRGRLGPLTPQQEEAIESLTRGLIAKIAHGPISELRRQAGQPEGFHLADAVRRMFRLGHR
jgi:glutamyl-tRNA reductase